MTEEGRVSKVEVPQYRVFLAKEPNGQCMVVLPGGGYTILAMGHEGFAVAETLNQVGITVVLVKYRVSSEDAFGYQFPVPLLDARRAIRTARGRAAEWKVDPTQIGVMGFSAGGHLAACATTMFEEIFKEETGDAINQLSCRPDFSVLGYPVILMGSDSGHRGSQRRLIGENASEEMLARVKVIDFISAKTPPVYLVHSADDGVVPIKNSLAFIERCAEFKVPVSGQIFADGGHGWGVPGRNAPLGWTDQLVKWLSQQKAVAAKK